MKGILVNHKISVKRRLRLFDQTVSSCALWGCQSWTPRAEELRSLESARRAMLRRIVGAGRLPEEEWVHWIRRTTRKATLLAQACNVREWVKAHAMSKWAWAGHVARRPPTSWLWRVTTWRDAEWNAMATDLGSSRPLRPERRRWMKWEHSLKNFCDQNVGAEWKAYAADRNKWSEEGERFASY